MSTFENIANAYNVLAINRGYEVRLRATATGIEYTTLSGSLIWHYEKIAADDKLDFAIEVERGLVRIGERLAVQASVEAKEVAMNCLNGNCGRYQTKHIEGCEFAATENKPDMQELAIQLATAQEAMEAATVLYKRVFPDGIKFYEIDMDEITKYVRQARNAIRQEATAGEQKYFEREPSTPELPCSSCGLIEGCHTSECPNDPDRHEAGNTKTEFDYVNQAWVIDGTYQRCGHQGETCGCFGRLHAGEPMFR